MKRDEKISVELTQSQFCALLMGSGYAVGAMYRDKCSIQGTIDWIAEAGDALRAALIAHGLEEPTDVKGPLA